MNCNPIHGLMLSTIMLISSQCSSNLITHDAFPHQLNGTKTMVVVQPDIDFFLKQGHREKSLSKYNREIEDNVRDAIINSIEELGINAMGADSIRSSTLDLFESVRNEFTEVRDEKSMDFHMAAIESELRAFADRHQDHLLVLARGRGYQRQRNAQNIIQQMNTIGFSNKQMHGLFLEIGIVDPGTGFIIWLNRSHAIDSNVDPLQFKAVQQLCDKLLKSVGKARGEAQKEADA